MYDIVFEGLIKNVERRYRETGFGNNQSRVRNFYAHHTMFYM